MKPERCPTRTRAKRLLTVRLRARCVNRDLEILVERGITADQRTPAHLLPVATSLLRHFDPVGSNRNGVELTIELQLTLDRLVELCGHRSSEGPWVFGARCVRSRSEQIRRNSR